MPVDAHAIGSISAMLASLCWTLAPFLFASAVREIGSHRVNPLRLLGATAMLLTLSAGYCLVNPSAWSSLSASSTAWLVISGIIGLVIGDAFYLSSLGHLGPRRTLQMLVFAPVVSAAVAWIWLGEAISALGRLGMAITLGGLFAATMSEQRETGESAEPGRLSWKGLSIAFLAVIFHGAAAVLARKAYLVNDSLDPILATTVRITASAAAIWAAVIAQGRFTDVIAAAKNRHALRRLAAATAFGPVAGMLFYVGAFKAAPAGVVSLLSSLSPVLIIPITAWRYRTRLQAWALVCVILALGGVALVMLR